jgi:16S rRNA (cytidine1402-2'-O)-methyltransferase
VYEQVRRAPLGELAGQAVTDPPRGEITLVVAGAPPASAGPPPSAAELAAEVADLELTGTTRKDAIAAVAVERGLPKREVYGAVVQARLPRRADDSGE